MKKTKLYYALIEKGNTVEVQYFHAEGRPGAIRKAKKAAAQQGGKVYNHIMEVIHSQNGSPYHYEEEAPTTWEYKIIY